MGALGALSQTPPLQEASWRSCWLGDPHRAPAPRWDTAPHPVAWDSLQWYFCPVCALFAFIPPLPSLWYSRSRRWPVGTSLRHAAHVHCHCPEPRPEERRGCGWHSAQAIEGCEFWQHVGPLSAKSCCRSHCGAALPPWKLWHCQLFPLQPSFSAFLLSSPPHPSYCSSLAPSAYSHCSKARLEWLEERCVRCMFFFPNCPLQESLFPARVVYDLLFFFIVIIIVLNLIFGVIIDTFADLRSEKQKKEEILKTTCFICGECWDPGSACLQELPPCGSSLLRLTCGMREGKEFPLLWVFIWFTAKLKSLHWWWLQSEEA